MSMKTLIAVVSLWVLSIQFMFGLSLSPEVFTNGNSAFAFDLYQRLRTQQEGNLFFSPYSISEALAMTYAGARGDTEKQMATVLHFSPQPQEAVAAGFGRMDAMLAALQESGEVTLGVANSIWPAQRFSLLPGYVAFLKEHYGISVTPLDFSKSEEARRTINGWVESKTQDKIKDLIGPGMLDARTSLVLVNAIYFKGDWLTAFKETKDEPFHLAGGETVTVPMMQRKFDGVRFADLDAVKLLELPYKDKGRQLSMVVILPKYGKSFAEFESQWTPEQLTQWIARLSSVPVQVALPKFKITWGTFSLNETLIKMGMVDAFGNADFSGMNGKRDLAIGAVLHKAFIDVDEKGTEAAAATAVVVVRYAFPRKAEPVQVFRADRPFLFLIRESRTGTILFMGRVMNPLQN